MLLDMLILIIFMKLYKRKVTYIHYQKNLKIYLQMKSIMHNKVMILEYLKGLKEVISVMEK